MIAAISIYDAFAAITVKPAYSPAEALQRRLASVAAVTLSPAARAAMPRENATAKYPSPMGIPSRIPSRKMRLISVFVFFILNIIR